MTVVGFVGAVCAWMVLALIVGEPMAAILAALTPDRLGAWLFWLAWQFPQSIYVVPLACGLAFAFVVDRLTFRLAD